MMLFQSYKQGYAALISILFFLSISLLFTFGFSALALQEKESSRLALRAKQSYALAESGVEDAAFRLQTGKQLSSSETISLNGEQVTTTITTLSGGDREIRGDGTVFQSVRSVQLILTTDTGASFQYGVQVGEGGVTMQNSSSIVGNVYSNGNIQGQNSAQIIGDAFVAGASEIRDITVSKNAHGNAIYESTIGGTASSTTIVDDSTVGVDVYADSILNTIITDDAYYQTSLSGGSVGGVIVPGTPPPPQLPPLAMPIPDSQIDLWKTAAEAGGTITGPCPYAPSTGTSLGPVKIICDVNISGNTNITLTGPVWIVGNLTMRNNAQINLASSYGIASEVIIAEDPANPNTKGSISVLNNTNLNGSGTVGSYILAISMNRAAENGMSDIAITINNSANAPIYYAPHGEITIQNNSALKEATAYKISLSNSTQVTYETGLADITFSSGPSGSWSIASWREVE
jgi:Tfp pilus assembly protein PilX